MAQPLHRCSIGFAFAGWLLVMSPSAVTQTTNPFTAGIDRCDNARVVPTQPRRASYRLATGEVELPLVFAPGLGWFRARLDPAGNGAFRLRDAVPTCEDHPLPATYAARSGEVRIPEIDAIDERGVVQATYDATLVLDNVRGVFTATQVWPLRPPAAAAAAARRSEAAATRKQALADALVQGVELAAPPDPYMPGDRLPLARITGGRIGGVEAGCSQTHLHGTIMIDGTGPFADPNPSGCGHGVIVMVEPTIATSVVNVTVPLGARQCGPDITDAFLGRLRSLAQRLSALPDSEKGTFDGTMFLARNGGNIDFEVRAIRTPAASAVCPTLPCVGDGFVSTVTLCGRCVISHVDNDIQYGFVARALGVPMQVQVTGAAAWDLWQRGGVDPPASIAAYILGNAIGKKLAESPGASNSSLCESMTSATYRTITFADVPVADIFAEELLEFGKDGCQPCVYRCPESLVFKDFTRQGWVLDGGSTQPPP